MHHVLVGISVKEILLDVVPVSVKDLTDQAASVKITHASVTSHVVPQQQSAILVVSYSILTIEIVITLYNS